MSEMQILIRIFTSGLYKNAVISGTFGICLYKNTIKHIIVSNHRFLIEEEVFHSHKYSIQIDNIKKRYNELDIAMICLVFLQISNYFNNIYF